MRTAAHTTKAAAAIGAVRRTLTSAVVVAALILAAPMQAHASAYGAVLFGGGDLPGVGWIPNGKFEHKITGSGLRIDRDHARFDAIGTVCRWRIDFLYYDTNGSRYYTSYGPLHTGCNVWGNSRDISVTLPKEGLACAKLISYGKPVPRAKQCHSIHR